MKRKKRFNWFTGGGFEDDPFLTEEDRDYYRKKLERAGVEQYPPREPKEPREKDNWL